MAVPTPHAVTKRDSRRLHLRGLQVGYAGRSLLNAVDAQLVPGRLTCLLGPNGAGKSTLLRTLCGMQSPVAGGVSIDDLDVHAMSTRERACHMAVVLTDRIMAGGLRVHELVAMGRHPHTGWNGKLGVDDHAAIAQALADVDAQAFAQRAVNDLSDGERQRVMLARALTQQPSVLLLDEVLAFLDLPRRVQAMALLRQVARERGIAVILSCHDLDLALRWADTLWVLPGDARLCVGAPEALALDGTLGNAFANEGLHFDTASGEFVLPAGAGAPVTVEGTDVSSKWLRRAMVRIGRQVGPGAEDRIGHDNDMWYWKHTDGRRDFSSVSALLDAMQA